MVKNKLIVFVLMMVLLVGFVTARDQYNSVTNGLNAEAVFLLDDDCTDNLSIVQDCVKGSGTYNITTPFSAGKSLWYDGVDGAGEDYLDSKFVGTPRHGNYTVSIWVQSVGTPDTNDMLMNSYSGGLNLYLAYRTTTGWKWSREPGTAVIYGDGTNTMLNGSWNNIMLRSNGSTNTNMDIFINGVRDNYGVPDAGTVTAGAFVDSIRFLAYWNAGADSQTTRANIDEVIIWNNTALSDQQIADYFDGVYSGGGAIPPPEDSLNISNASVLDGEIFNTRNLSINLTVNASYTFNATLYINGAINQTKNNLAGGTNIFVEWNVSFTATDELNFTYFVNAIDNTTQENTSVYNVWIDNVQPNIYWFSPLNNNQTAINWNSNASFNTLIQLDDPNLYSYEMNISWPNGTVIYNFSNSSLTGSTTYNITQFVNMTNYTGNFMSIVKLCDGHTDQNIYFKEVEKENNQLTFEGVKVYLKDMLDTKTYNWQKRTDRYNFVFETDSKTNSKTFIVESPDYIDILNGKTEYFGHLVTGNKWIDFESNDIQSVNIKRISSNKVEVTVNSKVSKTIWFFDSIGELNCRTEERVFLVYNVTEEYVENTFSFATETFKLNLTYNSTIITNINASLNYNNTVYSAARTDFGSFYTFDVGVIIPNVITETNISFYWNYSVNSVNYNTTIKNQTVFIPSVDNCTGSSFYSINFTILNETDDSPAISDLNIYVSVWSDNPLNTKNINLSYTGNYKYSLCLAPPFANFTLNAQMEYESTGFAKKLYYLTDFDISNQTRFVNLYLTNGTTQVEFTILDYDDNVVEEAILKVLSYDVGTDSFKVTEILETDSNGVVYAQIIQNTQFYRFIVEVDGVTKLFTLPTKITGTSKTLRINLDETAYFERYNTVRGITHQLSYTNASLSFQFTYDDASNDIESGCLKVVKRRYGAETLLYDYCNPGTAGSIFYVITDNVTTSKQTYIASSYVKFSDGEIINLDTESVTFDYSYKQNSGTKIFVTFLLTITLIFIGVWSPVMAVVLGIVAIVLSIILGIFFLSWGTIIGLIIMGAITIYRLNQ